VHGDRPFHDIEISKRKATLLLKRLCGSDDTLALRAAARIRHASYWAAKSPEDILAERDRVQHKHALDAIAVEAGFDDWRHMKAEADARLRAAFNPEQIFGLRASFFLNLWFTTYEEARASLAAHPQRFLFPYRSQFVICDAGLLADQGIDAADPDWELIGHDWVRPRDPAARDRLSASVARQLSRASEVQP